MFNTDFNAFLINNFVFGDIGFLGIVIVVWFFGFTAVFLTFLFLFLFIFITTTILYIVVIHFFFVLNFFIVRHLLKLFIVKQSLMRGVNHCIFIR